MIKTIFFDLDGTLLPMDQERFVGAYLAGMGKHMAPYGYDPALLAKAMWRGTGAMVKNDGSKSNYEVFWDVFNQVFGEGARKDEPLFESYYHGDFQNIRHICGFDPKAKETIDTLKDMGFQLVLATNPLFPAIATQSRVRWAGLEPEDFDLITTYENASCCKPNPDYYREILGKLNLKPENCLMVGNDVQEDMVARTLGMKVFLLTDGLIDRENSDLSQFPYGSFAQLLDYIRSE